MKIVLESHEVEEAVREYASKRKLLGVIDPKGLKANLCGDTNDQTGCMDWNGEVEVEVIT